MSLPVLNLDDRRFQDIVDEAKRLIPIKCPEWTNHNVSDPGVALIELFAWMTEMTLFRLNQIPDHYYTAFLNLIGIDAYPAMPARADLTFWLSTPDAELVQIPEGVTIGTRLRSGSDEIVFATDRSLLLRQPVLEACMTTVVREQPVDRWEDLAYGRAAVACFGSTPPAVDDAIYFGFARPLASHVVRLDIDARSEGLGIEPRRPPLRWEAWTGEGWERAEAYGEDGTGGLNKRGTITLAFPDRHEPLTLGTRQAHWLRARVVRAVRGQPEYRTSPRIRSMTAATVGGVVPSRHAEPVGRESLGPSDGTPGQRFRVSRAPVVRRRREEHVELVSGERTESWKEVADFGESGPEDRHYTWSSSTGEIAFGPLIRYPDGSTRQYGAVPSKGSNVAVTGYRTGGGARGNVGERTLTLLRTTIPFVDRVENRLPARGGVDAETVENVKQRGPLSLRTGQRAVTAGDFERLTLRAGPDIARARCLAPAEPGGPVRLLVVPRLDADLLEPELDDMAIDDEMIERIGRYLDTRRLIGTTVEIAPPFYRGASVAARVEAGRGWDPDLIRQRVADELHRFIHPVLGGVQGRGLPFHWDLTAGFLVQMIAQLPGVQSVDDVLLFAVDLRTRRRLGGAREILELDDQSLFMSFRHQVVVR